MMSLHINIGFVSKQEMSKLTIAQTVVLAAYRRQKSLEEVAELFGKDTEAVRQMLKRIKRLGLQIEGTPRT